MKTAVLLVNLGTPAEPTVPAVRSYLREFLSDPYVIDLPYWIRRVLVNLILLKRPRQSAEAYQTIWLSEGSPLLVYTQKLQSALQQEMGDHFVIEVAMRYGQPTIAQAVKRLQAHQLDKLIVLPLFPQYSRAVTGSILQAVQKELTRGQFTASVQIIESFCAESAYLQPYISLIRQSMLAIQADYLLLSYHGLPERQMHYNPNYKDDCVNTSRAIAVGLNLLETSYQTSYQSRLGRTPWIQPYTDYVLKNLREQGIKRLAVACPSFVVDCLETLEEIGIRAREQWLSLGGEDFILVPALNANQKWVKGLAAMLRAV